MERRTCQWSAFGGRENVDDGYLGSKKEFFAVSAQRLTRSCISASDRENFEDEMLHPKNLLLLKAFQNELVYSNFCDEMAQIETKDVKTMTDCN